MAAHTVTSLLHRLASELGVFSILQSPRDIKTLCLQRFVRLFAYGASTLILALYLSGLGSSDARIGLFMTLTLVGDLGISFVLSLVADGLGRRNILILGAFLITASGTVFALSGNYWVLLAASISGVISPSGNEIGPFKAIEESTLAQLSAPEIRSDIFAWYILFGNAGVACGTIISGFIVQSLISKAHWTDVGAYRIIFVLYATLGLIKLGLSFMLSDACEAKIETHQYQPVTATSPVDADFSESEDDDDDENARKIQARSPPPSTPNLPKPTNKKSIWPAISPSSLTTLLKLSLLFAVDSFASGLVPLSWLTYFFHTKHALPSSTLGTLFFTTNIIAALSNLVASSLAKRIGLIKAMIFTHLPSAIFLALIPLPSKDQTWLAMLFLILRSSMATMDQAPRQAFLSMAVLPGERTAVMGVVNVVKTSAQSGGPVLTGWLAGRGMFWVAFLVAGGLKAGYDLGMLGMFLGFRGPEEREGEGEGEEMQMRRAEV